MDDASWDCPIVRRLRFRHYPGRQRSRNRKSADDPFKSVADIPIPSGGHPGNLDPQQLARLQALADKRDQSLETMTELIRKQREAQQAMIDNMR